MSETSPVASDDLNPFTVSPPDSPVAVTFGKPEQPHGDELTFFEVHLVAEGLNAGIVAESLSGDWGVRELPEQSEGDVTRFEDISLSGFLRELGGAMPWDGFKRWRSLADELSFGASCDLSGHVTLVAAIRPRPWEPTWEASATFMYALGDLPSVADALELWFTSRRAR